MNRPRFLSTRVTRLHARILRASGGRLRRSFLLAGGQTVLVLTTTGRKSGQRRSTPVAYIRDGDNLAVVGSNGGLDRTPAWWLNLQADPHAEVDVEGHRHAVVARHANPDEQERLFARFLENYSGFEDYTQLTDRDIPVVILEPR